METRSTPEFYTAAPVDPVDLRFREGFLTELWETLRTGHVVLTAPRRTGKTSVMDHLRDHPVFDAMVVGSAARVQLRHFHSGIQQYYAEPNRSVAHELLGRISRSGSGLRRAAIERETERTLTDLGVSLPAHERRRVFNQLLLDLENDFYIIEVEEGHYEFASGVLKSWWRKHHA